MKLNFKHQYLQDYSNLTERSNDFARIERNDFSLDNLWNQKALNRTEQPVEVVSGYWRTNHMLEDCQIQPSHKMPGLKHLTSFEENSMEDHGKKLKNSFQKYIKLICKQRCPEELQTQTKAINFSNQDWLEQTLALVPDFELVRKEYIIELARKNSQAELLLRIFFSSIPSKYLSQFLIIVDQIFDEYQKSKIQNCDQDEVEGFIQMHSLETTRKIKELLKEKEITPNDQQSESQFEQLIKCWMQVIFLSLNGVFEGPENRKNPLNRIDGIETFYTSRKLIKFD